eukprot:8442495-Lingulodinium_polyedra.AAC.1
MATSRTCYRASRRRCRPTFSAATRKARRRTCRRLSIGEAPRAGGYDAPPDRGDPVKRSPMQR